MTQKRPSSPLPVQNCKKRATLTDGSYGRINGDSHESLRMILQKVLVEQVELVEELVFKDSECQRLKKKYDEVDRNCRRWHEFAIGLQSRVKRLALILHRQQDSIINLKNKGVSMVDAAVQTEFDLTTSKMHDTCSARIHGTESKGKRDCLGFEKASCLYIATSSDSAITKCDDYNKPTGKVAKDKIELSFEPDPGAVPHSSVVIDLTDEETMKNSLPRVNTSRLKDPLPSKLKNAVAGIADNASVVNSIGYASGGISSKTQLIAGVPGKNYPMANGGHPKPLVAVQQVESSFDSSQVRQVNHVPVCLKTKANAQKTNNTVKDDHLAQKPIGLSISPAKNNVGNVAPYPLLPSMPLPPQNLPKNIPPSPSQPMLRIRKSKDGIELSWDHPSSIRHVKMDSYELFVFQHNPNSHSSNRWKKIGSDPIKAMPLPMACTLSQFSTGSKYYFVVRGKDLYGRYGPFSAPCCSTEVQQ